MGSATIAAGALVASAWTLSTPATACYGCSPSYRATVGYNEPVPYVPLSPYVYHQSDYLPYGPMCVPARRSAIGRLLDPSDDAICGPRPTPVYIVNQGPVMSGPNVTVYSSPYVRTYGPVNNYPYVGLYNGGPYAEPTDHRFHRRAVRRHAHVVHQPRKVIYYKR